MLKLVPNSKLSFNTLGHAKCAEVYCQNAQDFSIVCTFCEIKSFDFADFVLHIKNLHFENDTLKTENIIVDCSPYPIKEENGTEIDTTEKLIESINQDENPFADTEFDDNKADICGNDSLADSDSVDEDYEHIFAKNHETDDSHEKYATKKRKRTNKEYTCEHCSKIYTNKGNLTMHVRREHKAYKEEDAQTNNELLSCDECKSKFPDQRLLELHHIRTHGGAPCPKCDRKFKDRRDLRRHVGTHNTERSYICDFENCSKGFTSEHALYSHKRIHTAPKNIICEICGYSCRIKEMLRLHLRTHTGEKPYSCSVCQKSFASSSLLSEHKATHTTDRPHVCEVCGATFGRPKALYHHKFLHLSVKKFICKICGNAYAQAAGLAGHMRKHKEQMFRTGC